MLPTDPANFTLPSGQVSQNPRTLNAPAGRAWSDEWTVLKEAGRDADGWVYNTQYVQRPRAHPDPPFHLSFGRPPMSCLFSPTAH